MSKNTSGSKLYIVSEFGYEYDDNNYFRGENTGYYPRTAHRSEKKANEVCDSLNLSEFKNLFSNREIINYGELGYMLDDDNESNKAVFLKYFGTTPDEWWDNPDVDWVVKPTEESWQELYTCFDVSWYNVTMVNLES